MIEEVMKSKEYELISEYYGDRRARRSNVPLINHIDEALIIMNELDASLIAMRAFCLHPLLQDDEDLAKNLAAVNYDLKHVDGSLETIALALEYRNIANAYLSHSTMPANGIRLSPLEDVNMMLVGDKVQNRKDFELYHKDTHANSERLAEYFGEWLDALDVSEYQYEHLIKAVEDETKTGGLKYETAAPSALREYLDSDVLPRNLRTWVRRLYTEPHRHYHGLNHLDNLLVYAYENNIALSKEQALAILYHDAVYTPGLKCDEKPESYGPTGDNEYASAMMMERDSAYFAPDVDVELVKTIILDTIHHVPSVPESEIVLDLDLMPLAASPEKFAEQNDMIFEEYKLLCNNKRSVFDDNRRQFLIEFLSRDKLFYHLTHLEEPARANLLSLLTSYYSGETEQRTFSEDQSNDNDHGQWQYKPMSIAQEEDFRRGDYRRSDEDNHAMDANNEQC